jgi:putative ATP-binding cassette transporter
VTASVSDIGADAVVATECPPDFAHRNVWGDVAYMVRLLAFHVRRDWIFAVPLWVLLLGAGAVGSYLQLRYIRELANVTNGLVVSNRPAVVAALTGAVVFIVLTAIHHGLQSALAYTLRIRIRTALTGELLRRWLGGRGFYRPLQDHALDHPEQRVQEDVYNFGLYLIQLAPALVTSATTFYLYSNQLWLLSSPLPVSMPSGGQIIIPRALYVLAIATAIVATLSAHLIGRIYTRLDVVRQRIEAGFRHDLGQAREFAEQIVLGGGQALEEARARHDYALIRRNWRPYTGSAASLEAVRVLITLLASVIPTVLLFPLVLAGKMQVGDLTIAGVAFGAVFHAFGSISTNYDGFALLRSASQRIQLMDESLSYEQSSGFVHAAADRPEFAVRDLEVRTAAGHKLFSIDKLTIGAGERWLVRGMSGSGKSTFFRVMSGIWPFGSGTVEHPSQGSRVMFLPQKPYLPNGTLAELLSYPSPSDAFAPADYRAVLTDIRLERLIGDIGAARSWAKRLSPGEQQRVVLARALLQKPDFLFLDEATSSLDPKTEAAMFDVLARRLPDTSLVTIAHTDRLTRYHSHQLQIENGGVTIAELKGAAEGALINQSERSHND